MADGNQPPAVTTIAELANWCDVLHTMRSADINCQVDPSDQLTIENLIAQGVALLAGEDPPRAASAASDRRVLARDLWITADLVQRALQAQLAE